MTDSATVDKKESELSTSTAEVEKSCSESNTIAVNGNTTNNNMTIVQNLSNSEPSDSDTKPGPATSLSEVNGTSYSFDLQDPTQSNPECQTTLPIDGSKTIELAPMLDVTTREFRSFIRILSKRMVNWTEMVVDSTLCHWNAESNVTVGKNDGDSNGTSNSTNQTVPHSNSFPSSYNVDEQKLGHCPHESPIVCQLGGNNPDTCGRAAIKIVKDFGYKHINLNVGCPSDRVSGKGEFGASLMLKAESVYNVIKSIREHLKNELGAEEAEKVEISIKTRIGVDSNDSFEFLASFIEKLSPVCNKFILHARKCILNMGLTPAQNRTIPPLNYKRVYEICEKFPQNEFWINGGVKSIRAARQLVYGRRMMETEGVDQFCSDNYQDVNHVSTDAKNESNNDKNDTTSGPQAPKPKPYTKPRYLPPSNLKGVLIGRAAMDNPSIFADVDRYFYGDYSTVTKKTDDGPKTNVNDNVNPVKTRRQALELYATYLEKMYPRRCAWDTEKKKRMRSEHFGIGNCCTQMNQEIGATECCEFCKDVYDRVVRQKKRKEEILLKGESDILSPPPSKPTSKSNNDDILDINSKAFRRQKHSRKEREADLFYAAGVISRSMKPVLGIFYQLPGNKQFRREIDELSRNLDVRDCGPGYILRRAMQQIEGLNLKDSKGEVINILDQEFMKTEDTKPDVNENEIKQSKPGEGRKKMNIQKAIERDTKAETVNTKVSLNLCTDCDMAPIPLNSTPNLATTDIKIDTILDKVEEGGESELKRRKIEKLEN